MAWRQIAALALLLVVQNCAKPRIAVAPCDEDLGYAGEKIHLANVRFLQEDRSLDWFEIYENLEEHRHNVPAHRCIPVAATTTVEQKIERREYELRSLR